MARPAWPINHGARRTPRSYPGPIEQAIVALRQTHPAWGGRKIAARLIELGHAEVPPPSTVTSILHRHGLISPAAIQRGHTLAAL